MTKWTAIPGETPIDPSGLRIPGITTRQELNAHEFREIQRVMHRYFSARPSSRMAPFDLPWLERLHGEMFGAVWDWAGRCRNIDLNLGVRWEQCQMCLQEMLDNLAFWHEKESMDLLERAVRLHHRAVQIHPFNNGNGRWARMLSNIYLKQNRHPIVVWPDQTIENESVERDEYIRCLAAADNGDFEELLSLHRRFIPAFVIEQAWSVVSVTAERLLGVQNISFRALGSRLLRGGTIDAEHHDLLSQLRGLQRRAKRQPDAITADDATEFTRDADRLLAFLERRADPNS